MKKQLTPLQRSKHERTLFSVMGRKHDGPATALIIAPTQTDAESYALDELGFVAIVDTTLVSAAVHVGVDDTRD